MEENGKSFDSKQKKLRKPIFNILTQLCIHFIDENNVSARFPSDITFLICCYLFSFQGRNLSQTPKSRIIFQDTVFGLKLFGTMMPSLSNLKQDLEPRFHQPQFQKFSSPRKYYWISKIDWDRNQHSDKQESFFFWSLLPITVVSSTQLQTPFHPFDEPVWVSESEIENEIHKILLFDFQNTGNEKKKSKNLKGKWKLIVRWFFGSKYVTYWQFHTQAATKCQFGMFNCSQKPWGNFYLFQFQNTCLFQIVGREFSEPLPSLLDEIPTTSTTSTTKTTKTRTRCKPSFAFRFVVHCRSYLDDSLFKRATNEEQQKRQEQQNVNQKKEEKNKEKQEIEHLLMNFDSENCFQALDQVFLGKTNKTNEPYFQNHPEWQKVQKKISYYKKSQQNQNQSPLSSLQIQRDISHPPQLQQWQNHSSFFHPLRLEPQLNLSPLNFDLFHLFENEEQFSVLSKIQQLFPKINLVSKGNFLFDSLIGSFTLNANTKEILDSICTFQLENESKIENNKKNESDNPSQSESDCRNPKSRINYETLAKHEQILKEINQNMHQIQNEQIKQNILMSCEEIFEIFALKPIPFVVLMAIFFALQHAVFQFITDFKQNEVMEKKVLITRNDVLTNSCTMLNCFLKSFSSFNGHFFADDNQKPYSKEKQNKLFFHFHTNFPSTTTHPNNQQKQETKHEIEQNEKEETRREERTKEIETGNQKFEFFHIKTFGEEIQDKLKQKTCLETQKWCKSFSTYHSLFNWIMACPFKEVVEWTFGFLQEGSCENCTPVVCQYIPQASPHHGLHTLANWEGSLLDFHFYGSNRKTIHLSYLLPLCSKTESKNKLEFPFDCLIYDFSSQTLQIPFHFVRACEEKKIYLSDINLNASDTLISFRFAYWFCYYFLLPFHSPLIFILEDTLFDEFFFSALKKENKFQILTDSLTYVLSFTNFSFKHDSLFTASFARIQNVIQGKDPHFPTPFENLREDMIARNVCFFSRFIETHKTKAIRKKEIKLFYDTSLERIATFQKWNFRTFWNTAHNLNTLSIFFIYQHFYNSIWDTKLLNGGFPDSAIFFFYFRIWLQLLRLPLRNLKCKHKKRRTSTQANLQTQKPMQSDQKNESNAALKQQKPIQKQKKRGKKTKQTEFQKKRAFICQKNLLQNIYESYFSLQKYQKNKRFYFKLQKQKAETLASMWISLRTELF